MSPMQVSPPHAEECAGVLGNRFCSFVFAMSLDLHKARDAAIHKYHENTARSINEHITECDLVS